MSDPRLVGQLPTHSGGGPNPTVGHISAEMVMIFNEITLFCILQRS